MKSPLFLLSIFLFSAPLFAGRPDAGVVLREVHALAHEQFQVRRDAYAKLREWSESYPRFLLQTLAEAYRDQKDMEITIRLEELMKPLAEELFLALPSGFIGINMEWRFTDSGTGVGVAGVLDGHPGKAAGLQEGDIILALNEEPVAKLESLEGFAARVAGLPPGTLILLEVLRGRNTLNIPLELGARPEHMQGVQIAPRELQTRYEAWLRELARQSDDYDPDFPIGHFPLE